MFWEYIKYSAQIILSMPKVRLTIALTKIYVILSDLCYLGLTTIKNNIGTKLGLYIGRYGICLRPIKFNKIKRNLNKK